MKHTATFTAALLKVDSVADFRDRPVDQIYELTHGATLTEHALQWVFNLAEKPNGQKQDLRFLTQEVIAQASTAHWDLATAIDMILPRTITNFHSGHVCRILKIRRPTLKALRSQLGGSLNGNSCFFPRVTLVTFLQSRWLRTLQSAITTKK